MFRNKVLAFQSHPEVKTRKIKRWFSNFLEKENIKLNV